MSNNSEFARDRSIEAECLVLEMSGQAWYVPFNTLRATPRVGESVRLGDGSVGKVAEIEYEFAPEPPPVEVAKEMPASVSYARLVRILIRVS